MNRNSFPITAFKIAMDLIQNQLMPQAKEPADLASHVLAGRSALRFMNQRETPTATAAAPKILTTTGQAHGS